MPRKNKIRILGTIVFLIWMLITYIFKTNYYFNSLGYFIIVMTVSYFLWKEK